MKIRNLSQKLRYQVVQMSHRAKAPHLASALSCLDIIIVLYEKILKLNYPDSKFHTKDLQAKKKNWWNIWDSLYD